MSAAYEKLDQKPFGSHYRYFETTIARPVEKVWPHALNIGSWMTDHRMEPLSGERGTAGFCERVYAAGIAPETTLAHHHYYGIAAVVPYKYIALEVFPEVGGSYGDPREWIGFDGIVLVDLGGSTKVIVLLLIVDTKKPDRQPAPEHGVDSTEDATGVQLARYFANLKRLAAETEQ
ncbi:MAG TPA: hypothetical protein VGQ22_16895 [Steroidobacteraceae bacterium]|jgi:hypothetical protein|nr:hypothetical protein [Steroidobacteraceae bacterium]